MRREQGEPDTPGAVVELETQKLALAPPFMYQVMLHNDDYTSMDFVVVVLKKFFNLKEVEATKIMQEVHKKGIAVCGIYTRDIAETKVLQVTEFSKEHHFPLLCTMQKVEY